MSDDVSDVGCGQLPFHRLHRGLIAVQEPMTSVTRGARPDLRSAVVQARPGYEQSSDRLVWGADPARRSDRRPNRGRVPVDRPPRQTDDGRQLGEWTDHRPRRRHQIGRGNDGDGPVGRKSERCEAGTKHSTDAVDLDRSVVETSGLQVEASAERSESVDPVGGWSQVNRCVDRPAGFPRPEPDEPIRPAGQGDDG